MTMETQKKNVSEFKSDVKANSGYRYTTNAPYSSEVANRRITEATLAEIPGDAASLIDVGCGDGTYTQALKSARPSLDCTGFDPATDAVDIAGKKYPGCRFIAGDLLNPSTHPDRKFDIAIVRGVLHHLPDATAGIANAMRLSDRIVFIEPNGNNPILKWLERNSEYHISHEEQSFTSRQLVEWCAVGGYAVRKLDFIGFVPFFFPAPLARIIHFFQPFLEKLYPVKKYFGAQIVIVCTKNGP